MLQISHTVSIPEHEINLSAVRSALRSSTSRSQIKQYTKKITEE
ncbi:hypothetical protein [Crinalium epipsammum]|nr:hypothetical protein [Crinalium epipsammum]